jgi:hypothetical protein
MPKIIKGKEGVISLRLDGAYVTGGKYLVEKYVDEDTGKKRHFGNFKFDDPKTAKKIMQQAVQKSDYEDTIFYGDYPNWKDDEKYGESLSCQNRVKFYKSIKSGELVDNDDINDYIYSIEVHLKKSKEGGIFLVVARAIVTGKNDRAYNDDLFEDFVGDDVTESEEEKEESKNMTDSGDGTDEEDDLPF